MAKGINGCIGRSAGQYNKKLSVIGDETRKIVLKKLDGTHNARYMGNIYIPETGEMNNRLSKYTVVDRSKKCLDDYGVEIGDTILADRLACYYDTDPIQVMDYENVICGYTEDETPQPLNGMIFIQELVPKVIKSKGIVLLNNYEGEAPIGIVYKSNSPLFQEGEIVLLTTGADVIIVNGVKCSIYKDEMILGVVYLTDDELDEYK